jgi:hypothetical protein
VDYDEETLMAYADGELAAPLRAEIEAALAADPALAFRVEKHRALRAQVAGAYAGVMQQPVPEPLREAAKGSGVAARPRGNVVQFPTRGSRAPASPWRAREWLAVAASLVLGIAISWRYFGPANGGLLAANGAALVARGALATALDEQLAGAPPRAGAVTIGLTFHARDGSYCRSFTLRAGGTAGLACRVGGEWQVPVTASGDAAGGDLRQAGGSIPAAVLQAIEARIAGDVLTADAETRARNAGWKPARQ